MLFDFHTHTTLSDGVLLPMELIRRAIVAGYTALGISDHCSASTMERVTREVKQDCELARRHWDFVALTGVELTHVPAEAIADLAAQAKGFGAEYVVVHGESPVEPVAAGTNLAACRCANVDILAHPGLLSSEAAEEAAANGVFIELTCRQGHCLGNGLVARVAAEAGAKMLVNTDAHAPDDLLSEEFARTVAMGAGLQTEEIERVLVENPIALLSRVGIEL
jgi:putative hydrolase